MPSSLPKRPPPRHETCQPAHPRRHAASGPDSRRSGARHVAAAAALSLLLLAACGGGGDTGGDRLAVATTPGDAPATAGTAEGASGVGAAAAPPLEPMAQGRPEGGAAGKAATTIAVDFRLESDYGPGDAPGPLTPPGAALAAGTDPAAAPVDRQARTRNERYISRAVAERVDRETGGQVVWVDASCCAGLDPELPERIAFGMQAVLGDDAPLFVGGRDLRQAARLADRLHALGVRDVRLVTP